MLHRHRKLNAWLQFGGHVEHTENPWQAITHELREESGYDISQLAVLQPPHRIKKMSGVVLLPLPIAVLSHKFPGLDHYHNDYGIGFVANEPPAHQPHEGESSDIKCFTLTQLQALSDDQIPSNVRETAEFILTQGLAHWEQMPSSNWSLETPNAHFE